MFNVLRLLHILNIKLKINNHPFRNLFIIGFSLLTPLTIANWVKNNPGAIDTGVPVLNQILTVLMSSSLFLGGLLGFIFDNTLPGTFRSHFFFTYFRLEKT